MSHIVTTSHRRPTVEQRRRPGAGPAPIRRNGGSGERGFTLIDMAAVIAVIVALYAMGAVVVYDIQRPREGRAWRDLQTLANGIYGSKPGEHGYLADLGELPIPGPGETLTQYLSRPPSPVPAYDIRENFITVGWHGPYGSLSSRGVDQDPWGNPWMIQQDGRLRSLGRNGVFDGDSGDDLVIPDYPPIPRDTIVGTMAVIVVDPRTGTRVLDDTQVTIRISNHPTDVTAWIEPSIGGFLADDLTPGRKRIDVEGQDLLLGANAFTEVVLPVGGVTSVTIPLRRDIQP